MQKQINVIGHLSSSAGLGNCARLFIELLRRNGYRVAGLDIDYHPDKAGSQAGDIELHESPESLPYDVNLVIVSIQLLPSLWRRRCPGLLAPRFKNVGLVFWELPVIPPAWAPSLALFDALLVCSHYVRHALETALPEVKTFFAEHPLDVETIEAVRSGSAANEFRKSLGLSACDTVFLSSFDLRSDYTRKNPLAVLDAFTAAFPAGVDDVRLVIKANGRPPADASPHPVLARIEGQIAADPRIVVFSETLPYRRVMALYSACDVYLSLHRCEGLGLGPMEAMLLGKLAIATGYSGNLTYMAQHNSMPVDYRLVEPRNTGWQYRRRFSGPGAAWAEPDHADAVAALRSAHEDAARRRTLAAAGRADIAMRQASAWSAPWLAGLERFLDADGAQPVRQRNRLRRRLLLNEVADPTLRQHNMLAVLDRVVRRARSA